MSIDTPPHPAAPAPPDAPPGPTVNAAGQRRPGAGSVDVARLQHLYRDVLIALGQDPDREGLRDTPRRVAAAWQEFLDNDNDNDNDNDTDVDDGAGRLDAVFTETLLADPTTVPTTDTTSGVEVVAGPAAAFVLVRGIVVWTVCEHHLLPFRLEAAIGYLPAGGTVLGLSKLARIAQRHAHRLQLQERWSAAVADEVAARTGSPDVGVWAEGEHLCMSMRGVRADTARTRTAVLRSRVRTDPAVHAQLATAVYTPTLYGAGR